MKRTKVSKEERMRIQIEKAHSIGPAYKSDAEAWPQKVARALPLKQISIRRKPSEA